jgi:predicted RNase H-like HicB family nuclease
MKKIRQVSLGEYITEALRNAVYEKDNSLRKIPCVVAEAPDLAGCYTQAENFEEARRNLVEAIELWITVALRNGENLPVINNCTLLKPTRKPRSQREKVLV